MSISSGNPDPAPLVETDRSPSLPLYLAAGVIQIAGLTTVRFQLSEPTFGYIAMALASIGLVVSYLLRKMGITTLLVRFGALFAGVLFLFLLRGGGALGSLMPPEAMGVAEVMIISALAFTSAVATFLMLTDDAVVFSCVWTIAIIGLAGTMDVNRELVICFCIFLLAASFLLVHQNYLSQMRRTLATGVRIPAHLLRLQLATAAATWMTAIVLGILVSIPLQMVGRRLSLKEVINRFGVPPADKRNHRSASARLTFDNSLEFKVGLGPVSNDQTEALRVRSDQPRYWRGRTFEKYSGAGWVNLEFRPTEALAPTREPDANGYYEYNVAVQTSPPRRKVERKTARFRAILPLVGSLFHAAEPILVRADVPGLVRRYDGTIGTRYPPNQDFEIVSDVSVATEDELDHSSPRYPAEIRRTYLDTNPAPPALQELAREAAGKNKTPYKKAEAIRAWVSKRCVYSLDARAVPPGRDSADFFLNESREGYCDLFATSLTVLCRMAGLPARVATGFNAGTASTTEPGTYILRNSNRHAWTEVYFTGYGWIPFDATIATQTPTATPQTPVPLATESLADRIRRLLPGVLAGTGALGLLVFSLVEFRRRHGVGQESLLPESARLVLRSYQVALHQARRLGAARQPTMSTGEHLAALREHLGDRAADALRPLADQADRALFAPGVPSPEDVAIARAALTQFLSVCREINRRSDAPRSPHAVAES